MQIPKREESALDSIEHELYNPKIATTSSEIHQVRTSKDIVLPTSWGGEDSPIITKTTVKESGSFGAKLLVLSLVLLVGALSFAAWRVVSSRNVVSAANIDMSAEVEPYVEGGESVPIEFTISNKNTAELQDAKITLLYKQGSSSLDEQEKIQERRELGTIMPNEYKKQDFSIVLYGREAEKRDIGFKLEYKVPGSGAVFTKTISSQVILKTPPISINVEGPDTLSIGQNGTYTFTVRNNSATTSIPSLLQINFPNTFTFLNSNEAPLSRSTSWAIKSLKKGESYKVTVTGYLSGKEGEVATFQAKLGQAGDSPRTLGIVYASQIQNVNLRASPLSFSVKFSSDKGGGDVLRYNDIVRFEVSYKNTSLAALEDANIVLSLDGDALSYKDIDPGNGYYDSAKRTITWNKVNSPDLAVLAPNAQGFIMITVPTVSKGVNTPKLVFTVTGSASLKGGDDVVATLVKEWAIQGSVSLAASTHYKNSSFTNTGPIPPHPNEETTYSTEFVVRAQNALSDSVVSFTLPIYVTWKGETTDTDHVTYNTKTRTVTWNVGALDEGVTKKIEMKLGVKPSQSHVGYSPSITSGIVLEAKERDSRTLTKTTLSPISTKLVGESYDRDPSLVVD